MLLFIFKIMKIALAFKISKHVLYFATVTV